MLLLPIVALLLSPQESPVTAPVTAPAEAPARSGLILARSLYENGVVPQPAAFLLARPGAEGEPWELETVQEAASEAVAQLGRDADGRRVFSDIDPSGERQGRPFRWVFEDGAWGRESFDEGDGWTWEERGGRPFARRFQIEGGTVFHLARWFEPAFGEPGVLTLSANLSYLKLWRPSESGWVPETLFAAAVGETDHRFRDLEVGDVDGDGADELVLVTHDQGRVFVLEQTEEGLVPTELPRAGTALGDWIFIHEVELGQFDDDAALEIALSPSAPNRADASAQPGRVERYDWTGEAWAHGTMIAWGEDHAKELLAADLDGSGRHRLFAAVEGRGERTARLVEVPVMPAEDPGAVEEDLVMDLGDTSCRFLALADLDGTGRPELVAATRRTGIQAMRPGPDGWSRRVVAPGYASAGTEHAIAAFDWDGNGRADVFAASDPPVGPPRLQRFEWDPRLGRFTGEVLAQWGRRERFLTWFVAELPAGR
jgi:hypothetical protein